MFKRTIEEFTCGKCGLHVKGNGYTNHCPRCLWSKHVDVHPGDRAAACGGLMKPVALEGSSPDYRIVHRCQKCGLERVNGVQQEDSAEALIGFAKHRGGG
ncbi:MAG TPA: RNHCP domain-containing protein [Candidatus Paceibacterota bacterium]